MTVLLLWAALSLAPPRVTAQVDPRIIGVNGNTWATCRVPRNEENRKITLSVPWFYSTEQQLEGAAAPSMFRRLLEHFPCVPEPQVLCRLDTVTGRSYVSMIALSVVGCEAW